MRLLYRFDELAGFPRLFASLVHDFPATTGLFSACGTGAEALLQCARRLNGQAVAGREEVLDAILAQNLRYGAHPKAVESIHKLRSGNCLIVGAFATTALFGGPIETFGRALTTLKASSFLNEQGISAVPLLWVITSSSPLSSSILDLQNVPRLLGPGSGETPPSDGEPTTSTALFDSALSQLQGFLPNTAFSEGIYSEIRNCYASGEGDHSGEVRLLARLLSRLGVVVFAPGSAGLDSCRQRLGSHPGPGYGAELLQQRRQELVRRGYSDDDGQGAKRASNQAQDRPATLDLLPFQVLPWVARVCGPEEVFDHALLRTLMEAFGVRDPIVLPSASMTVIEPKVSKVLDKFDLEIIDFQKENEDVHERVSGRFEALKLSARFGESEEHVRRQLEELRRALGAGDEGLAQVINGVQEKILYQVQNLRGRQEQSWQRQQDIARQQIDKARNYLFPTGHRQEQFLNIHYFLVRHGFEFLEIIYDHLDAFPTGHRILLYPP